MKIQWAPVKFIENDKEHVPDEVVHKRCSGTKKREADSPSDEARLGTLYAIRSRKRGSQAHLTGTTYNKDVSGLPERQWTESI